MQNFWDEHYMKYSNNTPSSFCNFVSERFLKNSDLVYELGCGNGRDGLRLATLASNYVGIDLSFNAIASGKRLFESMKVDEEKYNFRLENFSESEFGENNKQRIIIYSRFSLHSDTEDAENSLLNKIISIDNSDCLIAIEARTIHDELFGKGREVGRNSFETDHFRRFIDPQEFLHKVLPNFEVCFFDVSNGFAKYQNEDPIVMRIVLKKLNQ
jgi:tellurite methyltransferase